MAIAVSIGVLGMSARSAWAEGRAEATVRADIDRYVRAQVEDPSAEIDIPKLSAFAVDRARYPGRLRTKLSTRSEAPMAGRIPITVTLYAGDDVMKRSVVTVNIHSVDRIAVSTRNLRRGDVLGPDDLILVDRDPARLPGDVLRSLEDSIGLRIKSSVRKGNALRKSQLERMPIVERGERVILVLRSGALQIQSIGRTQEAGAVGELIRVRNLDSKRELSGRLDREGKVHVSF